MAGMVRTAIVLRRIAALAEGLGNKNTPFTTEQRDRLDTALELLAQVHNEREEDT